MSDADLVFGAIGRKFSDPISYELPDSERAPIETEPTATSKRGYIGPPAQSQLDANGNRLTKCSCGEYVTLAYDPKPNQRRYRKFEIAPNRGGQFSLYAGQARWWGQLGADYRLHECETA